MASKNGNGDGTFTSPEHYIAFVKSIKAKYGIRALANFLMAFMPALLDCVLPKEDADEIRRSFLGMSLRHPALAVVKAVAEDLSSAAKMGEFSAPTWDAAARDYQQVISKLKQADEGERLVVACVLMVGIAGDLMHKYEDWRTEDE